MFEHKFTMICFIFTKASLSQTWQTILTINGFIDPIKKNFILKTLITVSNY